MIAMFAPSVNLDGAMNAYAAEDSDRESRELRERGWLAEFAAGNERNLSAFIEGRRAYVEAIVSRRLRQSWGLNTDEVEDAVQITFLRVWKTAGEFAAAGIPVGAFIATCAKDVTTTIRRRAYRRREQRITSDEFQFWFDNQPSADPGPLSMIVGGETLAEIRGRLTALPERHHAVAVARFLEGHTTGEIADQLHMRRGTVSRLLAEARALLGVVMGDLAGTDRVQVVSKVDDDVEQQIEAVLRTVLIEDYGVSVASAQRQVEVWTGIRLPVNRIRRLLAPLRHRMGGSTLEAV